MSVDVELVFKNEVPHLLDLIGFGFVSEWLQIENFLHLCLVENHMATPP